MRSSDNAPGQSRKGRRNRLKTAAAVLAAVLLAWCCSRFFYQLMLIEGDSMLPSYHNLQLVILDKRDRAFQAGDVIAFRCEKLSSVLVKRIAACPGETACISGGTLYVDGQKSAVYPEEGQFSQAGLLAEPVRLQAGEYLVIGDNTGASTDSRSAEVGAVKESDIIGKVIQTVSAKEKQNAGDHSGGRNGEAAQGTDP